MGIIRNGILGGFRKKVGAITGAFWKDLNVIKALPRKSNKPPTEKQTGHRTKFGLVTGFLSTLSELIDIAYKSSGSKSPMNEAVAYHMKNAVTGVAPNYTLDYTKLMFSSGKLAIPSTFSVDTITAGKVDFNWSLEADSKYRDATDTINVLAYNPTKDQSVLLTAAAPRSAKTFSLQMPLDFVGDSVHCFFSFTSVKKKNLHSKSMYVLFIPIA
jgi:hypothetical protein